MNKQVIFKVELQNVNPSAPRIKLFERIVHVDGSLCVPYETLISSARFLFGSNCIVSFEDCLI